MEKMNNDPPLRPGLSRNSSVFDLFKCLCGREVDPEFLEAHMEKCDGMRHTYKPLFEALNSIVRSSEDMKALDNIKVICQLFRKRLQEEVKQSGQVDMEVDGADDGCFIKCENCKKNFDEFSYSEIIFLEQCGHIVCKKCVKSLSLTEWPAEQKVHCPNGDCDKCIMDVEIKDMLGSQVFEDMMKDAVMKAVDDDDKLVKCDCGHIMELVQGKIDYEAKDDAGKKLSPQAAELMSRYRIRCREC